MTRNPNVIGKLQLTCMIIQAQFGSAIITIAHALNEKAGTGAWVSCLLSGIINTFYVYLMWKLAGKAKGMNVMQMLMQRLGGFIGRGILIIMGVFYALISYLVLTNWIVTTDLWAYPRTPVWFLLLALISVCFYMSRKPIRVYARFSVLATIFMTFFILLSLFTVKDWNHYNVMPVLESGWLKILDGSLTAQWALMGIEFLLLLPCYYEHLDMRTVLRMTLYGNWATTIFIAFCTFSSTALFGTDMISYIGQPLLYQMKAISFNVIERFDLIVISIWILFILTSVYSFFMLFVSSISAIFKQPQAAPLPIAIVCAILLFTASAYQLTVEQLNIVNGLIGRFGPFFSFSLIIVILLLLRFAGIFRKSGGDNPLP